MTDPDHDIAEALASLRPRSPGPAVTAHLARELDASSNRRGVIIAWSAGLTALAAAFAAAFIFLGGVAEPEAPQYQLVRVEQSRPDVQFFRPVQMDDGSFARPVRVRWQDTTRWEDARSNTRLINYRPNDQLTLLPLETN
ncbi:MAG: hypothetical protein WCL05_04730 [Verrucomicrobiota bacterium]|jgi:hypothetical protein